MNSFKNGTKLLLAALMLFGVSCATSNHTKKNPEDFTLSDYIDQISGVRVTGNGKYAKVMVSSRKMNGMRHGQGWAGKANPGYRDSATHPPLFVVNGQRVGRDYQTVLDMLSDREIDSVELLSKSFAFAHYRNAGNYGVIDIKTKKESSNFEKQLKKY